MVRLIIAAGTIAMLSVGFAWIILLMFDSLRIFGGSAFQTVFVFGCYSYCIAVLIIPSEHKLFYVLSMPVLSQFLHLFQRYDFPAGANSLWRLLPFVLVDLYMLSVLIRFKTTLTSMEKSLTVSWVAFNFLSIAISPNLAGIYLHRRIYFAPRHHPPVFPLSQHPFSASGVFGQSGAITLSYLHPTGPRDIGPGVFRRAIQRRGQPVGNTEHFGHQCNNGLLRTPLAVCDRLCYAHSIFLAGSTAIDSPSSAGGYIVLFARRRLHCAALSARFNMDYE